MKGREMYSLEYKRWRRERNRRRGERVRATRENLEMKAKRRGLVGAFADWVEFAAAAREQESNLQETRA